MIYNAGGIFGNLSTQTPYKTYKFYVDFSGFVSRLMSVAKDNDILFENDNFKPEATSYYQLENNHSDLDFGFYVKTVNLPKYTMKTVKINHMDVVDNRPIKTSYGGEINLSIDSTFKNITKLSMLTGLFETIDLCNIWDKVYRINENPNVVDNSKLSGTPNIDIVIVDDKLEDSMVYRIINPIVTSIDFGQFSYVTNAINEIRMTINYNSWYVIDGSVRDKTGNDPDPWNVSLSNLVEDWANDGVNWLNSRKNALMNWAKGESSDEIYTDSQQPQNKNSIDEDYGTTV